MKQLFLLIFLSILLFSCKPSEEKNTAEENSTPPTVITPWQPYDQSAQIADNADHESFRMRYQLIQSKITDKNDIWENVAPQISNFSEEDYQNLSSLILEQDIPTIQSHISEGKLSYEKLVQWYLYRIVKYENDSTTTLHTIISINPNAVAQAREKDNNSDKKSHDIFGMPILLKDNINFEGLPTTAGAEALRNNNTKEHAHIVKRIEEKGGIILGKVNLSEWANFLHDRGPNGYSAIGGQTLNPYGRGKFDTGGSSSGSGTSVAVNYAVGAVGTETSGSILSPSSANSVVGLKPTVGLLSRGGIVPISSTLDTPGPMTKNITDNAILLSAMTGEDTRDRATKNQDDNLAYFDSLTKLKSIEGMRFGMNKAFIEDSLYQQMVAKIKSLGGEVVEFSFGEMNYDNFLTLLNADMQRDLPKYFKDYGSEQLRFSSIQDLVTYNLEDTIIRIPYGQVRFDGVANDSTSDIELSKIRNTMSADAIALLEKPMKDLNLDVILSINNWNAGQAALAKYPCLTLPMGYRASGEPAGITLIARPYEEQKLLQIGALMEKATQYRQLPPLYR